MIMPASALLAGALKDPATKAKMDALIAAQSPQAQPNMQTNAPALMSSPQVSAVLAAADSLRQQQTPLASYYARQQQPATAPGGDTAYIGGSPNFNEATGQYMDGMAARPRQAAPRQQYASPVRRELADIPTNTSGYGAMSPLRRQLFQPSGGGSGAASGPLSLYYGARSGAPSPNGLKEGLWRR